MKKYFGILAVAVAMLIAVPAQGQVKFGLKAGLNMTSLSFNKDGANAVADQAKGLLSGKNNTGFFVGATADVTIPLTGIGADISLLYDNRKIETEGSDKAQSLDYISIPVNLKYTLGFSSLASVYVAAGPQFSFNVGKKSWSDLTNTSSYKNDFQLKKSTLSLNLGFGATVLSHFRLGYNYNIGLGETADFNLVDLAGSAAGTAGEAIGLPTTGNLKNNTHQVSFTYLF